MHNKLKRPTFYYILVLPAILIELLVVGYPLVNSFIISMTNSDFTKLGKSAFILFGNYKSLLSDSIFLKSLLVTTYFVTVSIACELVLGMIMALALNAGLRGSGFTRALLVIPWALPGTVVAGIWRFLFQSQFGLANGVLRLLGFHGNILWLGSSPLAINAVIFAEVWRMAPFFGLMLLSGLSTISNELYEAAEIDGASGWQSFWRITFPLMRSIIAVVLVIRTIFAFQNLEMVYVLTRGGPGTDTYVLPFYVYVASFQHLKVGYGSAIAYYIALLIGLFGFVYIGFIRRSEQL